MRCPSCGTDDDRVVDSRPVERATAIRRRRECQACDARFTTFERREQAPLRVQKRSGAVVPFDRTKVLEGMARAAENRIGHPELVEASRRIETVLRERAAGDETITTEQVGLEVLAELRELDHVTYVRFASVYKDFEGPEDFEKELHSLRKEERV